MTMSLLRSRTLLLLPLTVLLSCADPEPKRRSLPTPTVESPRGGSDPDWRYPEDRARLAQADMRLVTERFGELRVRVGREEFQAERSAWSSWWYPFRDDELIRGLEVLRDLGWSLGDLGQRLGNMFRGEAVLGARGSIYLSPLVKYDAVVRRRFNQPSQAALFHRDNRYNRDAPEWAGLCSARAYASYFEPEPQRSALVNNVCLSVGDQKALLIHLYEKVDPTSWSGWFGQRNNGRPEDVFADIYPHELLRFIQVQLGERKKAFMMDHNPGTEVWTEIVHGALVDLRRTSNDSVEVILLLRMADYDLTPEQRRTSLLQPTGTWVNHREYRATLYGEWKGSEFAVRRSRWRGASEIDHPDYVIAIPDSEDFKSQLGSFNPELRSDWVRGILEGAAQAPECQPAPL